MSILRSEWNDVPYGVSNRAPDLMSSNYIHIKKLQVFLYYESITNTYTPIFNRRYIDSLPNIHNVRCPDYADSQRYATASHIF